MSFKLYFNTDIILNEESKKILSKFNDNITLNMNNNIYFYYDLLNTLHKFKKNKIINSCYNLNEKVEFCLRKIQDFKRFNIYSIDDLFTHC